MSDELYQKWIEQRRAADPPDGIPDRVMQVVLQMQTQRKQVFALQLASWIERSRVARYVTCGAAMLIGSMPFITYFAYLMLV